LIINIIFFIIVGDLASGTEVATIPSATSKGKAVKGLPATTAEKRQHLGNLTT
jgi:hypothetical protein